MAITLIFVADKKNVSNFFIDIQQKSQYIWKYLTTPSRHTTSKCRRINVDAMWSRRIDVDTTSF